EGEVSAQDVLDMNAPRPEAEEDNISVTVQAEDALTLDVDGDLLLEAPKNGSTKATDGATSKQEGHESAEKAAKEGAAANGKKEEGASSDASKSDGKEDGKKPGSTPDKSKEAAKKGASSSGTSDQAKSSSKDGKGASKDDKGRSGASGGSGGGNSGSVSGKNLWVSSLSSSTKATDLKNAFSKYGKVIGAKIVTNARSPGARCYGFVTMATVEEATKCISHLHRTELHGRMISVERAKNDPASKKASDKKEVEAKKDGKASSSGDRKSTETKLHQSSSTGKKEEKKDDKKKPEEKKDDKDGKKEEKEDKKSSSSTTKKPDDKKGGKSADRTVVMDKSKGEPVVCVKTTSKDKEKDKSLRLRFQKSTTKSDDKKSSSNVKAEPKSSTKSDVLSFEKIREERERERKRQNERDAREKIRERQKELKELKELKERQEMKRIRVLREREEREQLQRERERLQMERLRLEKERQERERLERQRVRIEQERCKEQERIARMREELRRQQEKLRLEQERRASLKRTYDVDNRRDDSYWGEPKRLALDSDARYGQSLLQRGDTTANRFNDYDHRERGKFPDQRLLPAIGIERRLEPYDRRPDYQSGRSRDDGAIFTPSRLNGPQAGRRDDVRETRDRDDRRMDIPRDRPTLGKPRDVAARGHSPRRDSPRRGTTRDDWKSERTVITDRRDVIRDTRDADRVRLDRGREPDGHVRSLLPSGAGSSSYGGREPMRSGGGVIGDRGNLPHFGEDRRNVLERTSRDTWTSTLSQPSGYGQDIQRLGSDSRSTGFLSQ
uniref:SAFB-like, transcription modulator n=1 Tax=Petromyzon marinus TaxID=7757 RepID=S4RV05_PETMA